MTIALYAWASDADRDGEKQLTELRAYAAGRGRSDLKEYVDRGVSSALRARPALRQLFRDCSTRGTEIILVSRLDRFLPSVRELAGYLPLFEWWGVRLIVPSQRINTRYKGPEGGLDRTTVNVLAEFERDLSRQRVKTGLGQYRRDHAAGLVGKERHSRSKKDLPAGRPRRIFRREQALELRQQGLSWRGIARKMGVPQSTIRARLREP